MKKTISLLLCCVMLFLLCACGLSNSISEARNTKGFGGGSKLICTDPEYKKFDDKYVNSDYAAKSAEEVGAYVVTETADTTINAKLVDACDGILIASECFVASDKDAIKSWAAEHWDEYLFTHKINYELSTGVKFGNGAGLLKKTTNMDGAVRWEPFDFDEISAESVADSAGYAELRYSGGEDAEVAIVLGGCRFRPAYWSEEENTLISSIERTEHYTGEAMETAMLRWVTDEFDNAMEDYNFTKAFRTASGGAKGEASYEEAVKSLICYDAVGDFYYKDRSSGAAGYFADKPEDVRAVVLVNSGSTDSSTGRGNIVDVNSRNALVHGFRWTEYSDWADYLYNDYVKDVIDSGNCTGKGLAFYDVESGSYSRNNKTSDSEINSAYSADNPEDVGIVAEIESSFRDSDCLYRSSYFGTMRIDFEQETVKINLVDLSTGKSFASRYFVVTGYPQSLSLSAMLEKVKLYASEEYDISGWIDAQCASQLGYR